MEVLYLVTARLICGRHLNRLVVSGQTAGPHIDKYRREKCMRLFRLTLWNSNMLYGISFHAAKYTQVDKN
jgi:hypothetical protein